ncbi:MAG: hypothetical protein KJ061_08290 [Vicinamibacteraceae bacterium]|nr:hypothetical protein [Vicinamibacteraceae bacterium]
MSHAAVGAATPGPLPEDQAEAFLESLQDRIYRSLGLTADACQQREWIGTQLVLPARLQQKAAELSRIDFEQYCEDLFAGMARDEEAPRPTRFERPHQYSILRELTAIIEDTLDELEFELTARPVVGTLPTRLLEPLMLPVPRSHSVVVVVDGSSLTYVNLLARALAQALPPAFWDGSVPPGGLDRFTFPPHGKHAAVRFVEMMLATLDGNPAQASLYLPESHYEQLATELCEAMELFLLAREYGRLVSGEQERATVVRREAGGQTFAVYQWSREQDMRADAVGLAVMLAAATARGIPAPVAFWAADALLSSFGILERAAWVLDTASGRSMGACPTHHDERRPWLRQVVGQWAEGRDAIDYADALEGVLDTFEAHLESRVLTPVPRLANVH